MFTERNVQVLCSWIENIRSWKPCEQILSSMFSISEQNSEKGIVKLSVFKNYL